MKMKKRFLSILLSFALMLTMMPVLGLSQEAYAEGQTVVWSGEKAVTQDNPVSIDKDKFSGIKLGDKIVVEFKDADGGLLSLFSNGKCLPGTSYNYVGSWDSAYEVFATQDMIKSLKQYGMDVSGYGYTVTKVSYEAGRDNLDVNTVWSGNFWMDSWSTLELSATSFSDVDWDEIEAIRFISEAGRSNWTLNIRSSWDDDGKIADQGSMTWEDNYFELDLENIDMAAKLQGKDRLFIQGDKGEDSPFSFTQVQLVPKALDPVSYMAWDDTEKKLVEKTGDDACKDYTVVTADTTAFETGKWYVVNNDVTNSNRINVTGTAHLILLDGKTLTASKGIHLASGNTLNIYAGSTGESVQGNGALLIDNVEQGNAGIGGNDLEAGGTVTINGGEVTVTGGKYCAGIGGSEFEAGGKVTINGGIVNVTGGTGSVGIGAGGGDGNNGSLTLGTGVKLETSEDNQNWKDTTSTPDTRTQYMRTTYSSHTHSFTYAAEGATITATCANTDGNCTLDDGTEQHAHTATLTIVKPTMTTYGQTGEGISAEATITDENSIQGDAKVSYFKATKSGETYTKSGTALAAAPTDAGDYVAEITLGEANASHATASVGYTIAKADPTANAPTGLTATYGQTLKDVTLTNPEGNTAGTWAWEDAETTSVGSVGSNTFKATFTPDSSNYKTVENVEVTVTVSKAENPATVTGTASVTVGGNIVDLAGNVTKNGATGDVSYAISGEANGCSLNGSVLTSGNTAGTVTVNVTVAADANYNALAATPITITINEKTAITIGYENKEVTYTTDAISIPLDGMFSIPSGAGAPTYSVENGTGEGSYAEGKLTVTKCGTFNVTVNTAETATHKAATATATLTVNKAESSGNVTAISGLVYDGTEKALVNSEVHGGIFMYRLGTDGEWTEDIPEAVAFGTYTVYYYIEGDGNHKDNGSKTEPMGSVDVTIKCPYSNEWVDGKWYNKDGSQTYKPLGSWKKDGKDWMYADSSGWYAKNRWQKIDFKWYFFDQDGHMLKDAYQKDASGKIWYLGKNGAWDEKAAVIGWKQDAKGWWFGLYGNDYLKDTWKKINGNWYYFKSTGYIAVNEFVQGWWVNKNGVQSDPVKYSWHKSGSKYWYGTKDGWYAKSKSYTIDGKKYTFDKKGYTK